VRRSDNRRLAAWIALLVVSSTVAAGPAFEIRRYTIDAGGQRSAGNSFELTGTIGQPDAEAVPATGGAWTLRGGFWKQRASDRLFADGFEGG